MKSPPRRRARHGLFAGLLVLSVLMIAPATGSAAVGGPVILGGDDLTDHGNFNTTTSENELGWLYLQRAIENVRPNVKRSNTGFIAALGSADSTVTSSDAGGAIHFAAEKAGIPVQYFDGKGAIDQFFADLAAGTSSPAIVWIAGSGANNDLDGCEGAETEGQSLIDHAGQIDSFVNGGGGLISHGTCYLWLSALLPNAATVDGGSSDDLVRTPEGVQAFPGVTDADFNAGPWHNYFEGDLGGLKVLVVSNDLKDKDGNPASVVLGGAGVSLTQRPADLRITKSASSGTVEQGQNVTYTITVTNGGPSDATGMNVTDDLPVGVTFVSAAPSQGACSGTGPVSCDLGDIANGGGATVTIVARVVGTGSIENVARVSGQQPDNDTSNNEARVTVQATPRAEPGCQDFRYFIYRLHHGPGSKVTRVRVWVNGQLVKTVRGKDLKTVQIDPPPLGKHVVKIISDHSNGGSLKSVRTYDQCAQTKPKTTRRRPSRRR